MSFVMNLRYRLSLNGRLGGVSGDRCRLFNRCFRLGLDRILNHNFFGLRLLRSGLSAAGSACSTRSHLAHLLVNRGLRGAIPALVAVTRDRLAGQQAAAVPDNWRLHQRGGLEGRVSRSRPRRLDGIGGHRLNLNHRLGGGRVTVL